MKKEEVKKIVKESYTKIAKSSGCSCCGAKAEQEKIVKAKIENCARAKQAKATFDTGVRLSKANAAGEREILDDAGRAAEGKRIQTVIESDCK